MRHDFRQGADVFNHFRRRSNFNNGEMHARSQTMNRGKFAFLLIPAALSAQTASPTFHPLTTEEKLETHVKRVVSPAAFIRSAIAAAEQTWRGDPPGWKQDATGYGERYASSLASNGVRNVLAFGIDSVLHEDPRFQRLGTGSLWARSRSAMLQTLFCKNDKGQTTIAVWRIGSNYGSNFISNAWRPAGDDRWNNAVIRGSVGLGLDTAFDMVREFWPDIRKRLRRE